DCFDDCCCFTPAELAAWGGARGKPAGAPAPDSEDHCHLCESAAPAAPSPAPVALISALTCRAVALSIAWAPPLLGAPAPFELRVECATPALLCPGGQRAPAAPSREIPTPPPRF